jgi:hypothetical protein
MKSLKARLITLTASAAVITAAAAAGMEHALGAWTGS